MPELPIDHDTLFKELITTLFFEFLEFFAPQIAAAIDRNSAEFLDKEMLSDLVLGDENEVDILGLVPRNQHAVTRGDDIGFDIVSAQLNGQRIAFKRVLGQVARSAAMPDEDGNRRLVAVTPMLVGPAAAGRVVCQRRCRNDETGRNNCKGCKHWSQLFFGQAGEVARKRICSSAPHFVVGGAPSVLVRHDGLMKRPEPRQYITRLQKRGANLQSVSLMS